MECCLVFHSKNENQCLRLHYLYGINSYIVLGRITTHITHKKQPKHLKHVPNEASNCQSGYLCTFDVRCDTPLVKQTNKILKRLSLVYIALLKSVNSVAKIKIYFWMKMNTRTFSVAIQKFVKYSVEIRNV